ncbi:hypothetical protein SCA6_019055 [Theobroma cacao]
MEGHTRNKCPQLELTLRSLDSSSCLLDDNDVDICERNKEVWPSQLETLFGVFAGSYFYVAGALVALLKPGRMSMFGTLLVICGLVKEGILGKPAKSDPTKAVYVYPIMLIALICVLTSIKYDVKKVMRTAPTRPIAKPLRNCSKSKLK